MYINLTNNGYGGGCTVVYLRACCHEHPCNWVGLHLGACTWAACNRAELCWTTIGLAARLSGMEAVTQRGHKTTLASQAGCEPDTYLAGHVCVGKLPIVRGTARHPQGMTPSVSENTPGSVHAPPPPCHRAPRLVFGHLAKSYITSFTVQNVHNLKNINHRYRHRGGSLSI